MKFEDLPLAWRKEIKRLRRDSARYRTQRNRALVKVSTMQETQEQEDSDE